MKKKRSKSILLIALIFSLTMTFFVGCNKKMTIPNDLVCIKINNFMAEWENPEYNYNYEGSNLLNVNVPYTNVLNVTDCLISPESEVEYFYDEKCQKKIEDETNIESATSTKYIYVKVFSENDERIYKVLVTIDEYVGNGNSVNANVNPDGHILLNNQDNQITIGEEHYKVIRTIQDLQNVNNDLSANYIVANNLNAGDYAFKSIGSFENCYTGIFDGNNYTININEFESVEGGIFKHIKKEDILSTYGKISNIIYDADDNLTCNTTIVLESEGEIVNCTNYAKIASSNNQSVGIAGISKGSNGYNKISKCINYGNILSEGYQSYAAGIILNSINVSYCYNLGEVSSNKSAGIAYSLKSKIENCANWAEIEGGEKTGGILGQFLLNENYGYSIKYNINYGNINFVKNDYSTSDYKKYFGGICGISEKVIAIQQNKNYGKIKKAKYKYSHEIVGNYYEEKEHKKFIDDTNK